MEIMVTILFICGAISLGLISVGGGLTLSQRRIARRSRPVSDDDWNDQNPPKSLNYNYIDWLERELKVGKYDPDRIALGFDDTEPKPKPRQKPKPLDPEIDDLPMPDAVEVNERCPCIACRSRRRDARRVDTEYLGRVAKAKPVDDSWADYEAKGGLLRRIVDNHGNWTEIRSFGG